MGEKFSSRRTEYYRDKKTGKLVGIDKKGPGRNSDFAKAVLALDSKYEKEDSAAKEKEKKRQELLKKRNEILAQKRKERLKIAATPENAERAWRESIHNVENFCNKFGLKLLFNYSKGRPGSKVKARDLYIIDKDGKSHNVDTFFTDIYTLSKVKATPRFRTEIANKVLITIGRQGLINLLDNGVKRKVNAALNEMQILQLWKTTQRVLNSPLITPGKKPNKKPTGPTFKPAPGFKPSKPTNKPRKRPTAALARVLRLREQARNGNQNSLDTLRRKCFTHYKDPAFGKKGYRFIAKGPYFNTTLGELFPKKKVIWIKKADLLESDQKIAYIKLVRETNPITKKSEYYPADDVDRAYYGRMSIGRNDVVFIRNPFPTYKEAISEYQKEPLTSKTTRKLLTSLDFDHGQANLENTGRMNKLLIHALTTILGKRTEFKLNYIARGRNRDKILKRDVPRLLTAIQFAKERLRKMNKKFKGMKLEKMDPRLDKKSVIVSKEVDGKKYKFEFFLKTQGKQDLIPHKVTVGSKTKKLSRTQSAKFKKLRTEKALKKFLKDVFK